MCDADGIGVDTGSADRRGAQAASLAERYADIGTDFQAEMSILSDSSAEMPVVSGALDYSAGIVGQIVALQVHTGALGDSAQAAAGAARQADDQMGAGLGSVYAA